MPRDRQTEDGEDADNRASRRRAAPPPDVERADGSDKRAGHDAQLNRQTARRAASPAHADEAGKGENKDGRVSEQTVLLVGDQARPTGDQVTNRGIGIVAIWCAR